MILIQIICSLLISVGIILVLKINPMSVGEDVTSLATAKKSLYESATSLRKGKKKKGIGKFLFSLKASLKAAGREGDFGKVLCASLILFFLGATLSALAGNILMVPVLGFALGSVPFLYILRSLSYYRKHMREELETTLSIITNSYIRTDDIVRSVEENLGYIKPPLTDAFENFIFDCSSVSSDIKRSLVALRERIDEPTFEEWCDTLLLCQDDRTLKDTLPGVVSKLSDIRIVNSEISGVISAARGEYITMAGFILGNIPLIYFLNKDWFFTLVNTTPGRIVLAFTLLVLVVTAGLMLNFTRPVGFEGKDER